MGAAGWEQPQSQRFGGTQSGSAAPHAEQVPPRHCGATSLTLIEVCPSPVNQGIALNTPCSPSLSPQQGCPSPWSIFVVLPPFFPVPGASQSLPSHPSSISLCHSECGRRGSPDGTRKTATHTIWPGKADGKQNPQESGAGWEVQVSAPGGMAEDGPQLGAAAPTTRF